jgi:very-short-patch-repair endonuclease
MSKGERKIWFWLNDHSVNFNSQERVKKHTGRGVFIFDFFLPEKKLIIEYDGRQHYLPIEQWGGKKSLLKVQENDKLKDEFAELIGFKMLRIPYTQYYSVEEILEKALSRGSITDKY